ncbi:hypothetical protein [Pseudochrobactrum lubricantis]|uniref:hypothetical protein n=1 Tax=Pseudochrobactrum lubricantis TaxID=558172 RepID=UPI0035D6D0C0
MSAEAMELRKARERFAALGKVEWLLTADGTATFVEARSGAERVVVAHFSDKATTDEIDFFVNAPRMVDLLLRLVDRAIAATRRDGANASQQAQPAGKPVNYAAQAAMKCGEPAFLVFLEERHGLERPLTDERAAQKLRSLLRIASRKELNNDSAAAERWRSLCTDYQAWRKAGL